MLCALPAYCLATYILYPPNPNRTSFYETHHSKFKFTAINPGNRVTHTRRSHKNRFVNARQQKKWPFFSSLFHCTAKKRKHDQLSKCVYLHWCALMQCLFTLACISSVNYAKSWNVFVYKKKNTNNWLTNPLEKEQFKEILIFSKKNF